MNIHYTQNNIKMNKLFVAAASALLCISCAPTKNNVIAPNSKWALIELSDFAGSLSSVRRAELSFDEQLQNFHATTGCNLINGSLAVNGSQITFGEGPMTKMACNDEGLEDRFVAALFSAKAFDFVGDTLVLNDENKAVMKFVKKTEEIEITAGSAWNLVELNDFAGELPQLAEPALVFDETLGSFHATVGCNGINGDVTISGDNITLQGRQMTRMACHDNGLELTFVQALSKATTYALDGGDLVISSPEKQLMRFSRAQ